MNWVKLHKSLFSFFHKAHIHDMSHVSFWFYPEHSLDKNNHAMWRNHVHAVSISHAIVLWFMSYTSEQLPRLGKVNSFCALCDWSNIILLIFITCFLFLYFGTTSCWVFFIYVHCDLAFNATFFSLSIEYEIQIEYLAKTDWRTKLVIILCWAATLWRECPRWALVTYSNHTKHIPQIYGAIHKDLLQQKKRQWAKTDSLDIYS